MQVEWWWYACGFRYGCPSSQERQRRSADELLAYSTNSEGADQTVPGTDKDRRWQPILALAGRLIPLALPGLVPPYAKIGLLGYHDPLVSQQSYVYTSPTPHICDHHA